MMDPLRPDASASSVLDGVADGIYLVDRDRQITFWNQSAERIAGFGRAAIQGHSCADNVLVHVDVTGRGLCRDGCPLLATMNDGVERAARLWLRHKDGHRVPVRVRTAPVRDGSGAIVGGIETFDDDTALIDTVAQAVTTIKNLEEMAMTDVLTGLPNRRAFEQAALGRLGDVHRHEMLLSLLVVDIDRFKDVNTAYGCGAGDEALKVVGRTIVGSCRSGDFVARWGGEEFCVLGWAEEPGEAAALAERIRALMGASIVYVGDHDIDITVSIGYAQAGLGHTVDDLFRRASGATMTAKEHGRNRVAAA